MYKLIRVLLIVCLSIFKIAPAYSETPMYDKYAEIKYGIQSSICYSPNFSEITSLSKLPPQILKFIEPIHVSDRNGNFDARGTDSKPQERFIMGATNNDVIVMAVEQSSGITLDGHRYGYNVQLWTYLNNGEA